MKGRFKDTLFYEHWIEFKKNRTAMAGLIIIIVVMLLALFAPFLSLHNPFDQNISLRLSKPFSHGYILGSDDLGRDIFSRLLFGARISLIIGTISVTISLAIGIPLGLIAGFYGKIPDIIIMRIIDIMLAFPFILLTIVIVAILGPSLQNAMIAIGIVGIPGYARIVRASVFTEKEKDYVTAERSLGASNVELMFKSILPNCLGPIIVRATLGYAGAILASASLSYLGLGAQPPTPEWGLMISSARQFISTAWWVVTFPGIAILLSVLGFNLLGDGLRDILDPRLKE